MEERIIQKEKENIKELEEHKEIIKRYLLMNGFDLNSLSITKVSTGQVFVT